MLRIYKTIILTATLFLIVNDSFAQDSSVSINPALKGIYESRTPKKYTIAGIDVKGTKSFDKNLVISITGLAVGDVVNIPGTDVFNKAIVKLWKQSLVSNAEINITKLQETNIYIEIIIVERPRLTDYNFIGVKKGDRDDLATKCNLVKDRVLTEDMKLSAVEIIRKFYSDKGYRNVDIKMVETLPPGMVNSVELNFYITKGKKVKINSINFADNNEVADAKLKKQMKGTKEMTRISLYPNRVQSPYTDSSHTKTFKVAIYTLLEPKII
jgi:outer membrane protein insertion porin family